MSDADAIRTVLQRIRDADTRLRAFVHIAADPLSDGPAQDAAGPLSGVAVAVKDIFDTADMPTAYGSRIYEGCQPRMDAAIVTALKRAGAFVVGKTTTTEFATSPPTPTLNPRNAAHTPGGSSAGSAAAVAVGLVPVAIGTQTLGSVIRPASFCGVVGFKPTYGWFPTAGMKNLSTSLDTIGLLAASTADAERVYRALVPGEAEPTARPPRLAFSRQPHWDNAAPDARAAIEACVDTLRAAGVTVDEIVMPDGFDAMTDAANVIHDYEMHRSLAPEWTAAHDKMDPALAARVDRAGRWTAEDYRRALAGSEEQRRATDALIAPYSGVLCLAAPGEAPAGLAATGDPMMNSAWTALHVPCLTLPALRGANGLPIGLQIVSGRYSDLDLLRTAARLEKLLGDTLFKPGQTLLKPNALGVPASRS
jgi:Asp-tRNA(Asn)/Glu-tRNA(Gln) amidotransferase A subunit family amidase